jgi:acetyl-CoA acetyltransferase
MVSAATSTEAMRGAVALVGVADTPVGRVPGVGSAELCIQAIQGALADTGLEASEFDGLITCNSMVSPYIYHAEMIAEYLQIFPKMCLTVNTGGGTTVNTIAIAAAAIATGRCETVVIAKAENMATGLSRDQALGLMAGAGHPEFEQPYGAPIPAMYALVANAHMERFGTTSEQLARVAVSARRHASMHPGAQMRQPITVEDVLDSRLIADPLHLLDCSLVSDGGSALVLCSAQRAKDFPRPPAYVLGFGEGHSHEHLSQAHSLTETPARESGRQAYAMAGLGPESIDVAGLYDCFTPVVLIELEDLGFCKAGEAGAFVEAGGIDLGGELPVNTHGGLLSHCHPGNPGSMFHVTEAVHQLRGECGERQVEDAEVALVHAQGGILSSHATLILGSEATR